tara:strand:- start:3004 stop:4095 length:1092 start_codon:yes stop_codon:yes gene_type:complete
MKINLIFFLSEFVIGGAGNSIFKLCKNLSKKKYNIAIISLNKCSYKKELVNCGVSVYEVKSSKTIFAMPKIKKIVEKLIDNKNKNIFLSNIYYSNVLSILFLRSLNMKLILIERTPFQELSIYYSFIDFIKKNIIKFLIRHTYFKADDCISNSKYISNAYNNYYNLKFKTIYPPSFKKLNNFNKKKYTKSNICIGTVCRLSKEKKIESLIKVIAKFKNNLNLKIVGDGPELENLKKLTTSLNVEKNVIFLGKIHPNKIKLIIKDFDYFINSSDFEGFPNSVVEAISSGIPVIASQSHGGINEIIKNKNFGLIYNNDLELEIILKKIIDKKVSFKKNKILFKNHLKTFSENSNIKKYSNLFFNI